MQAGETWGRALVVGASSPSLKAVDTDARAVAGMLRARDFVVEECIGDVATRSGILAGYQRLIAAIAQDEPAVFYYAGHGFHKVIEHERVRECQGICPVDLKASTGADFRGITSWELSILQARLAKRCSNVTVFLDCCFAGQMSREDPVRGVVSRELPHPLGYGGFAEHFEALREQYGAQEVDAVDPLGSTDAVRLVACMRNGNAFEFENDQGVYSGAFTEALLSVLRNVGHARVSWAAIENAICERVQSRFLAQRPMIEGPSRRYVFSVDVDVDIGDAVRIIALNTGLQLQAGQLTGVEADDVYAVMPSEFRAYDEQKAIADLRVRKAAATTADVEIVSWRNGHSALPPHVLAFPIVRNARRHAVAVDVPDAERAATEAAVSATPTLRVATLPDEPVLATLRRSEHGLTIDDPDGPMFPATDDLQKAVAALAELGAAQRLRALAGEHGVLADEIEIEWGMVEQQQRRPMSPQGAPARAGDMLYVRVKTRAQRALFAHVFNIGLRGHIASLTSFAPAGVRLDGDDPEIVLGEAQDGTLVGLPLSWPDEIPGDRGPRRDEVIVIVTSEPADLRELTTADRRSDSRAAGSALEELIGQLRSGRPRSTRGEQAIDVFFVQWLWYLLHPGNA